MTIDRIIRSKRKTVALIVEPDGTLTVRAPERLSKRMIDALVREREDWIREKQVMVRGEYLQNRLRQVVEGEEFYYLGKPYPLVIVDRIKPVLSLTAGFELSRYKQDTAEQVFVDWYRDQARSLLQDLVSEFARQFGYQYRRIRITSAKKRWGSCNSHGGLNFSWRLVMLPHEIIEYVALHELVHTEFPNHSQSFWQKLESDMPDSSLRRKWLRDNGRRFHFP